MKSWNIKRPWYRGLAMIMSFVMTISLLSGCTNNHGPNPTSQTENTLDLFDTVVSGTTDSHSSVEYSRILSEEIIQEIHQINADLAVAAQAESEALETLSGVIEAGSLEDAKTALTAFTEKLSDSEGITQTWLSIQEQAENEIKAQVSQAAAQLLTQRAEAMRNEITTRKNQTETILESLEQALDSGNWEEAGTKTTELNTLLEPLFSQQTYGTRNNEEAAGLYSETTDSSLLALTRDTDINEDVMDLADELGTPLEIYLYLKNNIHYEYYYGSRKGANGTYAAYAGNDYDQASLLIGMLRYLGYEAEYVRGNIILEEEQALALTGTDTLAHAADVLASAGVPVTKYTRNGEVIKIQMEHVWVRALLPYTDYRGAGNAAGEALWIDLDTGIKAYESVDNIHDMAEETDLPAGLVQAVENGDEAAIESILNDYADTVDAMNPDTLYARKRTIKQEALSYLPASLQYKIEKELDTFSEISNTDKDSIRFETAGESLGSYTTSELAGRNILLTFLPASPADEELLRSYDTIFDVPASYVYMKPVLMIDGEVAVEAEDVETPLGTAYDFTITLNRAGAVTDKVKTVKNTVTVGSMYAVTIDSQMITGDELRQIYGKTAVLADSVTEHNVYSTDYLGQYLSLAGKLYFAQVDLYNILSGEIYGVCNTRKLSEGITGYEVQRIARYGIVTGLAAGSMYIDVDADDHAVISLTGDQGTARAYMMASGNISSLYESVVWEQLTGYESVSTLSILRKAKEQGIELLQINHDNLEVQMEKLNTDAATREAVRSAVTGGSIVTIPTENVTIENWNGTGYIVLDPATGAGSYMISGGLNGGEIPVELTVEVMASAIMAVLGTATLITVLSASIFAVMFPVAAIAAYTALILITTVWIVDMYCSYYDYIGSGNLESYSDTELMAFQLFLLADADLMLSQFIFSYYTVPYLKGSGEDDSKSGKDLIENISQIEYGSDDLSKIAIEFRKDMGITSPGRNVCIVEYKNTDGTILRKAFVSNVNNHSEEIMIDFLKSNNISGENVIRVFSEREPCVETVTNIGHNCTNCIMEYMPNAEVTYAVEYGITQEDGVNARNVLKELLDKLLR